MNVMSFTNERELHTNTIHINKRFYALRKDYRALIKSVNMSYGWTTYMVSSLLSSISTSSSVGSLRKTKLLTFDRSKIDPR